MEPTAASPAASPKELLLGRLGELGIPYVEHQTPVFRTIEDCRRKRGAHIPGVFCKNLFVRDKKKQYFLVCALEDTEIDLNKLRKDLGAARCLTFSTAEEMQVKMQVAPGGVSPLAAFTFGAAPDIKIILDSKIMEASLANFHPLHLESTLTLAPPDLLRFLHAMGQVPTVHDFGPASPPSSD